MQSKTRLQRKKEKESLKQAVKYVFLVLVSLFLLIRFGLPGLIRLAAFMGEIRSSTEPIETPDQLPPGEPILEPLPEATASAQIDIAGYADPGVTVRLFVRGISSQEAVTDNQGKFSFVRVHLTEGENDIHVEARQDQGKLGVSSKTQIVVFDQTPPELKLAKPQDGDRFFDTDSPIEISGQTEAKVSFTINGRFVLVDEGGGFSSKWPLTGGDNRLEIIATDKAGNKTEKTLTVNYTP